MSPEQQPQQERMGFREWTEHYEKEQESQRQQIGDLTKAVSSLTADVRTLVENQRGLFSRLNRPQPVAAYVSALLASIAVMISFSALLVNPIKEDIEDFERLSLMHEERMNHVETEVAVAREAQRWNEKMSDRNNNQIDQIWYQLKDVSEEACRLGMDTCPLKRGKTDG